MPFGSVHARPVHPLVEPQERPLPGRVRLRVLPRQSCSVSNRVYEQGEELDCEGQAAQRCASWRSFRLGSTRTRSPRVWTSPN
jgi:hypothetical protein